MTNKASAENMVAIVSFHGAVKREAAKIRAMLQGADLGGGFEFIVSVEGPIQTGEVQIEYMLRDDKYPTTEVKGNEPNAILAEFLRRKGWNVMHAPKAIANLTSSDDIPF